MPSGGGCARRTGAGLSEPGADRRSPPDTFFRREEEKQPLGEEGCRIFKQTDPRPSRFCCLKTVLLLTRCSGKKSIRHTLTALPLLLALEVISLGAYQRQRLRHLVRGSRLLPGLGYTWFLRREGCPASDPTFSPASNLTFSPASDPTFSPASSTAEELLAAPAQNQKRRR
ncbi:uncharacterized protein ACIQIH_011712 isoform 4-T4 [Cyanocitta cristata]